MLIYGLQQINRMPCLSVFGASFGDMHWYAEPGTRKGNAYITSNEEKKQTCRCQRWLSFVFWSFTFEAVSDTPNKGVNLSKPKQNRKPGIQQRCSAPFTSGLLLSYLSSQPGSTQRKPAGSKRDPPHTLGFALRSGALEPRATAAQRKWSDGSVGRLLKARHNMAMTWKYTMFSSLYIYIYVYVCVYIIYMCVCMFKIVCNICHIHGVFLPVKGRL